MLIIEGYLNAAAMSDSSGDKDRLSSDTEKCTAFAEQSINQCLQPLLDYAGKLQNKDAIQLPVQGTHIFRELCDVYVQFKECTQNIACSSISLEAVDASYGYMCGEGYKLFEDYATCFAEVETENNYVACKNEASAAIATAQKLLCEIMDHYLRCCYPVINAHCGRDAWELVRTVSS
uniref:DUF19 domain-containing protein n=1 Tax=Elaeophora elaphi TaxID=1147741 RepID=A0A0R3S5X5_9BILA